MKEEFRNIPGYEDYQVSNLGRVKSLKKNKERILKGFDNGMGYLQVTLYKNGASKNTKIHHLVALVFLNHKTNRTHNTVIDHIDNNQLNNRLDNLQLISNRYNTSKDTKGSSKYVGVHWHKGANKWTTNIKIGGYKIFLGYFEDEYEAHLQYQKALQNLHLYQEYPYGFRKLLDNIVLK